MYQVVAGNSPVRGNVYRTKGLRPPLGDGISSCLFANLTFGLFGASTKALATPKPIPLLPLYYFKIISFVWQKTGSFKTKGVFQITLPAFPRKAKRKRTPIWCPFRFGCGSGICPNTVRHGLWVANNYQLFDRKQK